MVGLVFRRKSEVFGFVVDYVLRVSPRLAFCLRVRQPASLSGIPYRVRREEGRVVEFEVAVRRRAIADAIADVADRFPAGTKLPPMRALAYELDVTVGTVSRAYALAVQEGHAAVVEALTNQKECGVRCRAAQLWTCQVTGA